MEQTDRSCRSTPYEFDQLGNGSQDINTYYLKHKRKLTGAAARQIVQCRAKGMSQILQQLPPAWPWHALLQADADSCGCFSTACGTLRPAVTLWVSHQSTFGLPVRPAEFSTCVGFTCRERCKRNMVHYTLHVANRRADGICWMYSQGNCCTDVAHT